MRKRTALVLGLGAGVIIGAGMVVKHVLDVIYDINGQLDFESGMFDEDDDDSIPVTKAPGQQTMTGIKCPICNTELTGDGKTFHCAGCGHEYNQTTVHLNAKDVKALDDYAEKEPLVCPECGKALLGLSFADDKPMLVCRKCGHTESLVPEKD